MCQHNISQYDHFCSKQQKKKRKKKSPSRGSCVSWAMKKQVHGVDVHVCAPCGEHMNTSAHCRSDSHVHSGLGLLELRSMGTTTVDPDPSLFLQHPLLAAMTELEKCMESLIFTFHRYAEAGGDGNTLSKKELKKLLENELPSFLKVKPLPPPSFQIPSVSTSGTPALLSKRLTFCLLIVLCSPGPEQPQAGGLHDERSGS